MNSTATYSETYRQIDGEDLKMFAFLPEGARETPATTLVAFHGGGWVAGTPKLWEPFGRTLSRDGLAVFLPQYRLLGAHAMGRSLWDLVADAHAAFSWVSERAEKFGLDPRRIGAAGGSAGAHLALGLSLIPPKPPTPPAPIPAFYILGNPVTDTSPEGFGSYAMGNDWRGLSPLHELATAPPPTLTVHGTADTTTPIEGARRFHQKLLDLGGCSELHEYPDRTHSFFNEEPDFSDFVDKIKAFISRLPPSCDF